jgi:hypothetical protein
LNASKVNKSYLVSSKLLSLGTTTQAVQPAASFSDATFPS